PSTELVCSLGVPTAFHSPLMRFAGPSSAKASPTRSRTRPVTADQLTLSGTWSRAVPSAASLMVVVSRSLGGRDPTTIGITGAPREPSDGRVAPCPWPEDHPG